MKCLLLFAAASGLACAACFPVAGSRILGRDLALADPEFSKLPATLTIGFAPTPGKQRIFSTTELERVARANNIAVDNPPDVCFEIPMMRLERKDAVAAMRRELPAEASLNVVELPDMTVPAGVIDFPIDGLGPATAGSNGVQLWQGRVKYAGTREAPVWARVAIVVRYTAVVAAANLPQDVPIDASSLRVETISGALENDKPAARIADVEGRIPKREFKAGAVIPQSALAPAPEVRRGQAVTVEVQSGLAHLKFEAIAESAGYAGEVIELRNPSSGKTFRARIGPAAIGRAPKALLIIGAGQNL